MASATILQTERIDLRELTPDDAHAVFELNADPEVLRFTGDVAFASLDDARRFLETYSDYRRNGFGRWAAVLRESGAFLGWCGLKRDASGEVDIGYRLLRAHWGRGYATEAARAPRQRRITVAGWLSVMSYASRSGSQRHTMSPESSALSIQPHRTSASLRAISAARRANAPGR